MFGEPVGINFKGKSVITTKVGSFFTLLTIVCSGAYAYSRILKLINKTDATIN